MLLSACEYFMSSIHYSNNLFLAHFIIYISVKIKLFNLNEKKMNPNFDYVEEPPSYQASYGAAPVPTPDQLNSQTGPVGPQKGSVGPNFNTGTSVPTEQSYQNQGPAFSAIPQQEVH